MSRLRKNGRAEGQRRKLGVEGVLGSAGSVAIQQRTIGKVKHRMNQLAHQPTDATIHAMMFTKKNASKMLRAVL